MNDSFGFGVIVIAVLFVAFLIFADVNIKRDGITNDECAELGGTFIPQQKCIFGKEINCYEYCAPQPYFFTKRGWFISETCECKED